jgi:hypothetical protein
LLPFWYSSSLIQRSNAKKTEGLCHLVKVELRLAMSCTVQEIGLVAFARDVGNEEECLMMAITAIDSRYL